VGDNHRCSSQQFTDRKLADTVPPDGHFAQATDVYAVPALRNLLFAALVGGGIDEMDLIAIDIQRARDVGVGTLNQTRDALGFPPYRSFAELTPDPVLRESPSKCLWQYRQRRLVHRRFGGGPRSRCTRRPHLPSDYRTPVCRFKGRRPLLLDE
jgi:Animal haem peroxidase